MALPPGAEFKKMPAAVCSLLEIHIDRCADGRTHAAITDRYPECNTSKTFLFLFLVHEARAQAYRIRCRNGLSIGESSPKEEEEE